MASSGNVPEDSSRRPRIGPRKSLTDTFARFAASAFNRRRTTTDVQASTSSDTSKFRSRLPTPSEPSSGSYFFEGFSSLINPSTPNKENKRGLLGITKPHRTSNLAPLESPKPEDDDLIPLTKAATKRHSTPVTHRALMAPLHPSQPRATISGPRTSISGPRNSIGGPRSSISGPRNSIGGPRIGIGGNLVENDTPSFMRSTSSSTARSAGHGAPRSSLSVKTTATPTSPRNRRLSSIPVPRVTNFSLPISKFNNPRAQRQISDATQPAKGDTNNSIRNSIHSNEAGTEETGSAIADCLVISPSQIPDRASTSTAETVKDLENIREVQVEAEAAKHPESNREIIVKAEEELAMPSEIPSSPPADQIHEAQHPIWWLGRFTSLSDRLRTEALDTSLKTSSIIPGAEPALMHDDERRAREVFIHLRTLCASAEVEASLEEFGKLWVKRTGLGGMDVRKKRTLLEVVMGRNKGEGSSK